jgi:hypothetical protein
LGVGEKEQLIQRGGGHYSEVLTPEKAPSAEYLALFGRQLERLTPRVARDAYALARHIHLAQPPGPVTVVSLARAGTPIGVLVHRALRDCFARASAHYSVSIIRDKGLDLNALAHICCRHSPQSVVFVDGWTGKGVIGRELKRSVGEYNAANGVRVRPALHVLADIAGTAEVSATREDYLLPSAVLNAPVSGLVSRTVLNDQVGADDFHGCVYLEHLAPWDQSRHFVDTIWAQMKALHAAPQVEQGGPTGAASRPVDGLALQDTMQRYLSLYGLPNLNFVKPGVGEATRVLLRRMPLLLALQSVDDPYVEHLIHLAHAGGVPVLEDPELPCKALALIDQPD